MFFCGSAAQGGKLLVETAAGECYAGGVTARQALYEGKVQGVGFRWTVKRIAAGYDVTGWVRNRADGRVELLAMGEAEEVRAFLTGIAESELKANIRHATVSDTDIEADTKGFQIVA